MKKERRWMKSIIAASQDQSVALPWQRGNRRRPEATRIDQRVAIRTRAIAAR